MVSTGFWLSMQKPSGSALEAKNVTAPDCFYVFLLEGKSEMFPFYFSLFPDVSFSLVFYIGPKVDF